MEKINFEDGQLTKKWYVVIDGKEYLINEAQYDGATPLSAYVLNKLQDNIEEGINNIQALPTGGTKGQVLTKQSETNGDANWEDIEANEVFVGNEEEAPSSAKIIIEEDDFEESAGLSKAEVYVGAEEPTTGEKVWFNKNKNSIYVRNSNGVYEELYNKEQINTLINRSSVGYSEVLYSDSTGVVAGSAGNAVILSKSVSNYAAILVVHQKGSCVVNNKLNTQNYGYGINIHWFNEGLAGTFYDNTVYKVVGLCKL